MGGTDMGARMKWRIGKPFWKIAYRMGFTMTYRYEIFYDVGCKRYIGVSSDIQGLVAECDTLEEVKDVIESDAPLMVRLKVFGADKKENRKSVRLLPEPELARGLVGV